MSDTPKSDDVTLDPETLERLQSVLKACTNNGCAMAIGVRTNDLRTLLDAAERLPQVEAERDRLREFAEEQREQSRKWEQRFTDVNEALFKFAHHNQCAEDDEVERVSAERDAAEAKLTKVREWAKDELGARDEGHEAIEKLLGVLNDA